MYSNTNDSTFSQPPFFTQSKAVDPLLSHIYPEIEGSHLGGSGSYFSSSASGSCSSYVGSPNIDNNTLFHRSISSHSLYKGASYCLPAHWEEFEECPVRRVCSDGDLEGVSNYMTQRRQRADSPLSISKENDMIIEGMMKVSKYSPEEKKERIERYRSKRSLRNFNKKIQYECRKTLADSRERIKGRFARNGKTPTMTTTMPMMADNSSYDDRMLNDEYSSTYHHHHHHPHHLMAAGVEDYDAEENSWINFLDYAFPSQNEH